ncbi:MAG: phytanoyl-CoA dioxygenase family protein [Psychrosphaera sp.]|nr:phytanoyl-CoA dioxygenase family protein [Psychrosphaera sp.]
MIKTSPPVKHPSRWHLSATQIQQFDTQGFLVLHDRIPAALLSMIKDKADLVQANGHLALKQNNVAKDLVFTYAYFQPFLNRVLHFHLWAGFDSLMPLGCPQLLSLAESLCGCDFVTTVDMFVYKHKKSEVKLPWHQDLIYQSNQYRVATAGIYLDDSNAGDGALKIIPNTQWHKQDICAIVDNPPERTIEINVKAGDILIHNPMMVHCSDNMTTQDLRRTLYYEFRPMAQVVGEETWPEKLLTRRLDLQATALDLYQSSCPDSDQFEWQIADPWRERTVVKALQPLYLDPIPFNTANFCLKQFKKS